MADSPVSVPSEAEVERLALDYDRFAATIEESERTGRPLEMSVTPRSAPGFRRTAATLRALAAEAARLRERLAEVDRYPEGVTSADHIAHDMRMARFPARSSTPQFLVERAEARAQEAREALSWYAEKAANCRKFTPEGNEARQALDRDGGKCARLALSSSEPPNDP